jgi:hypothetical protein
LAEASEESWNFVQSLSAGIHPCQQEIQFSGDSVLFRQWRDGDSD